MKIFFSLIVIFGLVCSGFSKVNDELSPDKRKILSSDWLETAKAYQKSNKLYKAKNCLLYSIELYPMGQSAEEARTILKDSFKVNSSYEPDKVFKDFVKKGDALKNPENKINSYLMALEVKQDKTVLQKTALVYYSLGNKEKTAEYLKKAVDSGLKNEEMNPGLKDINK